jgi:hypothetical protein
VAKQVIQRLVDDIDGSEAIESVSFGVDGHSYQIDLNEQHSAELRGKLEPFLGVARRVRHQQGHARSGAHRATSDKDRNSAIRQWALDEGIQLPTRGRIASAVQAAYDARDVAALYVATGLEREEEPAPPVTRRRALHREAPDEAPANPKRGVALKMLEYDFDGWFAALASRDSATAVRRVWDDAVAAPGWGGDMGPSGVRRRLSACCLWLDRTPPFSALPGIGLAVANG